MANTQKVKSFNSSASLSSSPSKNHLFELPVSQVISNARDEMGLSIEDVAEKTKISSLYIKLIESDDVHNHLERVYVLGFIRTYGNVLGLDADKLVRDYKKERNWGSYPLVNSSTVASNRSAKTSKKRSASLLRMPYVNKKVVMALITFIIVGVLMIVGYHWMSYNKNSNENSKVQGAGIESTVLSDGNNMNSNDDTSDVIGEKVFSKQEKQERVEFIFDRDSAVTNGMDN